MIEAVKAAVPYAITAVEEFPRIPHVIPRGFFGRIWAAILDKPTFEIRKAVATVRVVLITDDPVADRGSVELAIEKVRPAGIWVLVDCIEQRGRVGTITPDETLYTKGDFDEAVREAVADALEEERGA